MPNDYLDNLYTNLHECSKAPSFRLPATTTDKNLQDRHQHYSPHSGTFAAAVAGTLGTPGTEELHPYSVDYQARPVVALKVVEVVPAVPTMVHSGRHCRVVQSKHC